LYQQNGLLHPPIQNHQNHHNQFYNPTPGENRYSFSISDFHFWDYVNLYVRFCTRFYRPFK
jgi:hypothetical protein